MDKDGDHRGAGAKMLFAAIVIVAVLALGLLIYALINRRSVSQRRGSAWEAKSI
jgi:uncharacterized integral membrane protein